MHYTFEVTCSTLSRKSRSTHTPNTVSCTIYLLLQNSKTSKYFLEFLGDRMNVLQTQWMPCWARSLMRCLTTPHPWLKTIPHPHRPVIPVWETPKGGSCCRHVSRFSQAAAGALHTRGWPPWHPVPRRASWQSCDSRDACHACIERM